MNNSTNATTPRFIDFDNAFMNLMERLYYSYLGTASFYIVVGTPLCVWFIAAILTSPGMRKRLRNQLVCAICLSYMLKSTVSGGLEMFFTVAHVEDVLTINCYLQSFFLNLRTVLEFAGSWLLVNLLVVYLAQILDYDPTSTLTPMTVNVAKGSLLVLPVALAIILVPSIGMVFQSDYAKRSPGCIVARKEGAIVLRSVDYMVPIIISVILLIIAAVLYYGRFRRRLFTSRTMQTGLMGSIRQVDNAMAYLVAIFIDILCRLPATLSLLERNMSIEQRMVCMVVSWMITDVRSVIFPFCWLLLEDIRERIKIWRPWYRPAPGIDLIVTYSREEARS